MHWLSVVLGLIIGWAILSFIGPRRHTTSYYVQAPIRVENLSALDNIMEAVGLQPSKPELAPCATMEAPSPAPMMMEAPSPAPMMMEAPSPAPMSVADTAMTMDTQQQYTTPADQGMPPIPPIAAPAPGPAPLVL